MTGSTLLSVAGISKSFPGVKALDNVTFDVLAGEVHGLVGENGAGKSTLMAVASGALCADAGTVTVGGEMMRGDPERARALGIAIVRQEPSLMPDLTVAENLYLGVRQGARPAIGDLARWSARLLCRWNENITVKPTDRVETLSPEQRFIVEIVKALAGNPNVLILDEPTEHLGADDVERLFARIKEVTTRKAAVVYISHRIREVQKVADRLTVLRDGKSQGTYSAGSLSEDDIIHLIVGADLEREFPPKEGAFEDEVLSVKGLTANGFNNVTLSVRRGEILGLAGISDNGQHEFIRALAGLNRIRSGDIMIAGRAVRVTSPIAAINSGISYLPGDRHREGIFADLTCRENFSSRSAWKDATSLVVNTACETSRTRQAIGQFAIKTPSTETPIASLSGGNQQKLVLASVLASDPTVLLVDEPTQGVDVGARAEIYKILRENARKGMAIIVLSSDAAEIAGLCDRVAVFSRASVVETLSGQQVVESAITGAALKSTSVRTRSERMAGGFWRWAAGDTAPLVMIGLAILLMAAIATSQNEFYLSTRNMSGMLVLIGTLALAAYAQQILLLVGGIDLSVGPTMGLVQVVGSFYLLEGVGGGEHALGWVVMLAVALSIGTLNWLLVEPFKLHPMIATLATFMGVQAVSLILRPVPDGTIDGDTLDLIGSRLGAVPLTFVAALLIGCLLEFILFRHRLGFTFRALGSRQEAARVAGISPAKIRFFAYLSGSFLAFIAAVAMMEQIGIGDPRAGLNYTLGSIAAVVIGGTSLFGGRGSFIGSLLGAIFIIQVNTVTTFLGLDQAWQSYLLGTMIIAAVALYSKSRQLAVAA
ncbi:ATP-binding cassette domain-containing protein [Mesorhizobium sp. CO1-1-8]|uniref:ATP-binding cassette domain-containing protein n=1 Tax=Mesorhizobium sp. CO1-1-8 TaxID=2876631 RepID=UPI001CD0CAE7|nr:ATP-binding cassette domain-containing protein [Mesorhizobium sp. CO1-1-8]MBZ9772372.1 ATP-binding cassette domain-containing protein [Mesorhizobium sp. CO1-1-8]